MLFLHFFGKKFGHVKKKQYLCTRFRKEGPFQSDKTDEKPQGFEEERKSNGALYLRSKSVSEVCSDEVL